jgi:hypothetical protein
MAFLFKLETADGVPAEPATLMSAVPNWQSGDTIPLGQRTLRVLRVRDDAPTNRPCWSLRMWLEVTSADPDLRRRGSVQQRQPPRRALQDLRHCGRRAGSDSVAPAVPTW